MNIDNKRYSSNNYIGTEDYFNYPNQNTNTFVSLDSGNRTTGALRHQSGWCHRVESEYKAAYEDVFGKIPVPIPITPKPDVFSLIRQSGLRRVRLHDEEADVYTIYLD